MSKNARDKRPYIKPVTRIELSETNIKLRWIAIAALLAIAVVAIGYGVSQVLSTEPGWQKVEVESSETHYGKDFTLMYEFGQDGIAPTAEYKMVSDMYTRLMESAWRIFDPEAEVPELNNLYYLNRHPNEKVQVAHALYEAIELVAQYDSRYVFLSPVQELYDPVFLSANDGEAALYDPMYDAQRRAYIEETLVYTADPAMISVEVFGDDTVRLNVSEEYLAYAEENGIETFLDFGWMRNAFIIDTTAKDLAASGYTHGYLASYDGFTRNLDDRGTGYSLNIFHREGNDVYMPARLDYAEPVSIVFLRDYPMAEEDRWHYYAYESGEITTVFLDPADGISKSSVDGLTAYSGEYGCAEILLQIAPVFIADSFDAYELEILANKGIQSIRCYGQSVVYTEVTAVMTLLDKNYQFTISRVEE